MCDKKIYVKPSWNPDNVSDKTEEILKNTAESNLRNEQNIYRSRPCATNLSKHQFNILNHLPSNRDIIILMCDKNLGPAMMERERYIKKLLEQHLKDKNETYWQLTKQEASSRLTEIWLRMVGIVAGKLSTEECEYFSKKLLQSWSSLSSTFPVQSWMYAFPVLIVIWYHIQKGWAVNLWFG